MASICCSLPTASRKLRATLLRMGNRPYTRCMSALIDACLRSREYAEQQVSCTVMGAKSRRPSERARTRAKPRCARLCRKGRPEKKISPDQAYDPAMVLSKVVFRPVGPMMPRFAGLT